MKELIIKYKRTQTKTVLVDDEDFDYLNQWKWRAATFNENIFYAIRHAPKDNRTVILMHRLILGLTDRKIVVDHKDHNGLNNQRSNIRACTQSQNVANISSHRNSTSKYVGVCWNKALKKWKATICKGGPPKHLGFFIAESDAALAYNEAATKLHGEFANLNIVPV